MLGFPTPYPEELLYSTIARAGVHAGETSPKRLLDQVFANRKVIATVDLPCHVQALTEQYPEILDLDTQKLISRHTLLPVYAPFLPSERIAKLKQWMVEKSQGATHLASGIAASRVKAKSRLYVCVECLKEQKYRYGECYWQRLWQIPLVKTCPRHGPLNATNIELDGEHRHRFVPVEEAEILSPVDVVAIDNVFSLQAAQLLVVTSNGVSFNQWTSFYKEFANNFGFMNGPKIDHAKIHATVVQFWGATWHKGTGLSPSNTDTSWLKALFRKHRKSFSFAEHIVAVSALSNGALSISDVIARTSSLAENSEPKSQFYNHELCAENQMDEDQVQWNGLLKLNSPKSARQQYPALYARLYRNHHDWLLTIDGFSHSDSVAVNKRVDWEARDRLIARELRYKYEQLSKDLNAPQLSRTFLTHQLDQRATVEKNLYRLPRCSKLLGLYSENTTEYQARRLVRAYLEMKEHHQEIRRWSLLRRAGLSDERMTDSVVELLKEILIEQT
ncbi:TnsD family Tn7-like transposition protein [Teredinibacter turnerae]|uniref:TnsD family Tn7-like transposition protein n=1 Tax=Teredinibacter turnerae TaxID=2426 RepID=UPI00036AB28F|nr:TnsD family Tn7-like transposition protein [Teredinibacter turnerae]